METVRIVQDDGLKRRTLHRLFEPACARVQIASLVLSVGHIVDMLLTCCGLTAFLSRDKVSKASERSLAVFSTFFTLVL